MVLLDMAVKIDHRVRVFTLDTGRLPEETYQIIETIRRLYKVNVEVVAPDPAEVEAMVTAHGPNLFYREPALRKLCCEVRKVRPLERKLATLRAYVVGLRREQNPERANVPKIDNSGAAVKISPLADWSSEQVEAYLLEHNVPIHPLYARGYTSIGCDPCTRPVWDGEHQRSGRWWWEQEGTKECGIHFTPDGRVQRDAAPALLNYSA
jgi:thioredoxin-dependent adenylylsulfate APS reductase